MYNTQVGSDHGHGFIAVKSVSIKSEGLLRNYLLEGGIIISS